MGKILSHDEIQEHQKRIHESGAVEFSPRDIERQIETIEHYRKQSEIMLEALKRIVKYYDAFDEDAEGFKQAMSSPYSWAQEAINRQAKAVLNS